MMTMTKRLVSPAVTRDVVQRHSFAFKKSLGQNFLIDLNIHDLIVKAAEIGPTDVVLEVGPGAGALTALMADQASKPSGRRR